MLICDNIACKRGDNVIFQNISLKLPEGKMILLKGANGSGKTSLLKIISGLIKPHKGEVIFDKQNIENDLESYNSNIQFIGHKNYLNKELTVLENLKFWAKLSDTETLLKATIKFFKLDKVVDIPCYMLSEGWQKRVSLAKLFIKPSNLWLLDEPFANLDEEGTEMLLSIIASKCDQGGMVIASSHADFKIPFGKEFNISEKK